MFFAPRVLKKSENTAYLTIFRGAQNTTYDVLQEQQEQEQEQQQQQQQQQQQEEEQEQENKNKSGFEQFGSCEAAQNLNSGALTHTYVVCHCGEAPLAAPNLSTHCHVSFRFI